MMPDMTAKAFAAPRAAAHVAPPVNSFRINARSLAVTCVTGTGACCCCFD
jgi:hypothetical protein